MRMVRGEVKTGVAVREWRRWVSDLFFFLSLVFWPVSFWVYINARICPSVLFGRYSIMDFVISWDIFLLTLQYILPSTSHHCILRYIFVFFHYSLSVNSCN